MLQKLAIILFNSDVAIGLVSRGDTEGMMWWAL